MILSAASALPSDLRMMRMISSSASKTFEAFEQVDALFQRGQLVLQPPRDDLEAEVEEVPEDLLQIEALGAADLGVLLDRDETGQVDREVDLQRRVLEEIRHDHLLVGVLLHFDRDANVFGREILHVEQLRQLAAQDHFCDPLDELRLVDGVGHAVDIDRLGRARLRPEVPRPAEPDAA